MLHLRKLALSNVATHGKTEVELPEKGLICLTGSNGAGKSSLLESVATGLWGETLRGEACWRAGEPGEVTITTDQVQATRKRSKAGTAKLDWSGLNLPEAPVYETSTKAQAALESLIGSYDVWRRTCVLSSLDSAAFSLARDSDRKRLLEEFLGLGMFDTALDACRADRRAATSKAQAAESSRKEVASQLSFAQSQLKQAIEDQQRMLAETGGKDLDQLKAEGTRLADLASRAKSDVEKAAQRVRELERVGAAEEAKAHAEASRLARIGKDACPTCGQSVTDMRAHLQAEVNNAKMAAAAKMAELSGELEAAKDEWAELAEEAKALDTKLTAIRSDYRVADSQVKQRLIADERRQTAEKALELWTAKAAAQAQDEGKAAKEAAHLEAVEQVLGLRGVRAQVLDHALGALEQQANAWLSRMPTEQGALFITLAGSTTQKSGSVVDAISLRVRERPYAACSGGERRRVDVAILLALRELAVAAHGRDGSLLCDEVFDALDQQGQADVASALREMSQDRLVVVITHSPELVAAMKPDRHLHVSLVDGKAAVKAV